MCTDRMQTFSPRLYLRKAPAMGPMPEPRGKAGQAACACPGSSAHASCKSAQGRVYYNRKNGARFMELLFYGLLFSGRAARKAAHKIRAGPREDDAGGRRMRGCRTGGSRQ